MSGRMNCGLVHCSSARRFIRFNLSYIRYGLWNLVVAIILNFSWKHAIFKSFDVQNIGTFYITDWFSIFRIFSWKYAIQMIKSVKIQNIFPSLYLNIQDSVDMLRIICYIGSCDLWHFGTNCQWNDFKKSHCFD